DLPDIDSNTIVSFRVTATDASGAMRLWGETLAVQPGAIQDESLPIFVQRTGELARMPETAPDGRAAPLVVTAVGRYVVVTGGADADTKTKSQIYDLIPYHFVPSPPTLPRAADSMTVYKTKLLLIDTTGATWFDLNDSSTADAPAPTGGSYA